MESTDTAIEVYQLRIWIRKISPQIWRRLLVRSDNTIAELHDILQIAFDETIPKRGQTERLLERETYWLMQMAEESHWYQAAGLPPFWNGLLVAQPVGHCTTNPKTIQQHSQYHF